MSRAPSRRSRRTTSGPLVSADAPTHLRFECHGAGGVPMHAPSPPPPSPRTPPPSPRKIMLGMNRAPSYRQNHVLSCPVHAPSPCRLPYGARVQRPRPLREHVLPHHVRGPAELGHRPCPRPQRRVRRQDPPGRCHDQGETSLSHGTVVTLETPIPVDKEEGIVPQ